MFLVILLHTAASHAEGLHPLAPPDTSSPRATLTSFFEIMREERTLLEKDPFLASRASQQRDEQLEEQIEYLFDFRDVAVERVEDIANYIGPLMAEILDRIELPPATDIPDAATIKSEGLTRWTIPHTEITMIMIEDGPRQ